MYLKDPLTHILSKKDVMCMCYTEKTIKIFFVDGEAQAE